MCFAINGRWGNNSKWYESKFNGKYRWKWLGYYSYGITKKYLFWDETFLKK